MDFTAPSFSLGSEFDEPEEASSPARSDRYEQAEGYTAPDPPSFSLGIDFDGDDCGGEEPHLTDGGCREEEQRRYEAPDAPSFSLDIDSDGDGGEEPHLLDGGRREEQQRSYEAPDAPSFSLGIDSDGDSGNEAHLIDDLREGQQRRYEAPDAPSFSLGIEFGDDEPRLPNTGRPEEKYEEPDAPSISLGFDDDDGDLLIGGSHHKQARPQVTPLARTSVGIAEDDDDDFVLVGGQQRKQRRHETLVPDQVPPPPEMTRFKRLRRGSAPPSQAPTPLPHRTPAPMTMEASPVVSSKAAFGAIGSLEDEIEDFTDEERSMRDIPPSVGSCITSSSSRFCHANNSKFSLMSHGVLMSQSTSKAKTFTHTPNYSASKSLEESSSKKLIPKLTLSPMRKIHLLDSDSDSDDNKDKPALQQNCKSQKNTVLQKSKAEMNDGWATPALDEFCNEYFKSVKDSRPSQQQEGNGFCGPKVMRSNYSVSETGGHFPHQSTPSGPALEDNLTDSHPPAIHYFFHRDSLVRDLVRQRLQHFVPAGVDSSRANEQDGTQNVQYRSHIDQCAAANDRWVTPNKRTSVATEVGRRRVNPSGMSGSGHWFTGDDGKKVYVSKNGQELTGRFAYRQYKKESGKGFRKSKKKSSAGTKSSSTRAKKATTKVKQEKSTAKRKR
ncbi:hypothetical protein E2562_016812 [Oryza meyeriana var. granulata]|uniref:Uncharacterized protein n=1 Tax=Oryza meyeriana var. granulata TaxID=110450 RepID=A0A6G1BX56_9ORYZ|nr:hypothetical protein E2562_016812 [Oryza meyeriana var. granulata]